MFYDIFVGWLYRNIHMQCLHYIQYSLSLIVRLVTIKLRQANPNDCNNVWVWAISIKYQCLQGDYEMQDHWPNTKSMHEALRMVLRRSNNQLDHIVWSSPHRYKWFTFNLICPTYDWSSLYVHQTLKQKTHTSIKPLYMKQ